MKAGAHYFQLKSIESNGLAADLQTNTHECGNKVLFHHPILTLITLKLISVSITTQNNAIRRSIVDKYRIKLLYTLQMSMWESIESPKCLMWYVDINDAEPNKSGSL